MPPNELKSPQIEDYLIPVSFGNKEANKVPQGVKTRNNSHFNDSIKKD
jgi:hypothetical protein